MDTHDIIYLLNAELASCEGTMQPVMLSVAERCGLTPYALYELYEPYLRKKMQRRLYSGGRKKRLHRMLQAWAQSEGFFELYKSGLNDLAVHAKQAYEEQKNLPKKTPVKLPRSFNMLMDLDVKSQNWKSVMHTLLFVKKLPLDECLRFIEYKLSNTYMTYEVLKKRYVAHVTDILKWDMNDFKYFKELVARQSDILPYIIVNDNSDDSNSDQLSDLERIDIIKQLEDPKDTAKAHAWKHVLSDLVYTHHIKPEEAFVQIKQQFNMPVKTIKYYWCTYKFALYEMWQEKQGVYTKDGWHTSEKLIANREYEPSRELYFNLPKGKAIANVLK